MRSITVLGATSSTGHLLLDKLVAAGSVTITALTRTKPPAWSPPGVRWVTGDGTDVGVLEAAIAGADIVITMVAAPRSGPVGSVRSEATAALMIAIQRANRSASVIVVSALGGAESAAQQTRTARWIYRRAVGNERLTEVDRQESIVATAPVVATVVRPPRLDDRSATGYVRPTGAVGASARMSRADLAQCLADLASGPLSTHTTSLTVVSS